MLMGRVQGVLVREERRVLVKWVGHWFGWRLLVAIKLVFLSSKELSSVYAA